MQTNPKNNQPIPTSNTSIEYAQRGLSVSKRNVCMLGALIRYCLFVVFVMQCSGTEIQIITNPTQDNLKALNLMKCLRKYRVRNINLQGQTYSCYTSLKQKPHDPKSPSSSSPSPSTTLLNGNIPTNPQPSTPSTYSMLDLLQDPIGVKHYTKQFIYGYLHKRIVSQYDDQFTKYNNQKKELENFTMGVYQLAMVDRGIGGGIGQKVELVVDNYDTHHGSLKEEGNGNYLENREKPLSRKYAHEAVRYAHIDHQNKMLILTNPLQVTPHKTSKTLNLTFLCESSHPNHPNPPESPQPSQNPHHHNFSMLGISVTNYQIITMGQIPKSCWSVLSIEKANRWMISFSPQVNVLDNLLVGDLDAFCGVDYGDGLREGDFVVLATERMVEMEMGEDKMEVKEQYMSIQVDPQTGEAVVMKSKDEKSEKQPLQPKLKPVQEFFVVQITQVQGQNLYSINASLPWTLKIKTCQKVTFAPNKKIPYSGQISLLSPTAPLKPQYKIPNLQQNSQIHLQKITQNLLKIPHPQPHPHPLKQILHPGMQLFCMTEAKFSINAQKVEIQYFGLTVGDKFGKDGYYQFYGWGDWRIWGLMEEFGQMDDLLVCLPYVDKVEEEKEDKIKPLSRVIKMSKHRNNRIKFDKVSDEAQPHAKKISNQKLNEDSILMITMSKDAIFQIQTATYQSQTNPQTPQTPAQTPAETLQQPTPEPQATPQLQTLNKYYSTPSKIYKTQTHYHPQSHPNPNPNTTTTTTKTRIERTQNEFYQNNTNQNMIIVHGGIWRAGDFVKFPRFLFKDGERVTEIVVLFGTVFVRVVDLGQVNRQFFVVSSSQLVNHKGYGPRKRPETSLSTEYSFKWGTFCGGNINKDRETLIKLRCGQSWFKLNSVTEISPCVYELQIQTQYLCDKNVMYPALKNGFNTFNGSICVPANAL